MTVRKSRCVVFCVLLLISFEAEGKPSIEHLRFRASIQALDIYGRFDASTTEVYIDGKKLNVLTATDTLIEASFDSSAFPWHGDVSVRDLTGFSEPRRLSLYWLKLTEVYGFDGGTANSDARRIEFWLALPLDVKSLANTRATGWGLEPLPVSRVRAWSSSRQFSSDGDIYTQGSYERYLSISERDSTPGWSFALTTEPAGRALTIWNASARFEGTRLQQGSPTTDVRLAVSYKAHDINFDKDFLIKNGERDYNNFNPPNPRLEHRANWKLDSVQTPFDVTTLDVRQKSVSSAESKMVAYPNPSDGRFSISGLPHKHSCKLRIVNSLGVQIRSITVSNEGEIDISFLQTGLYSLVSELGESVTISKF